jgi:DNA-binding CsgD family transcriptional regulator
MFHDRQLTGGPAIVCGLGERPLAARKCAMNKNTKASPYSWLSPRERQVLRLVVEGRTSKEIAAAFGVKPSSIYTYRSRIMAKLEINDLPTLVRFAIRHGVIKL